MDLLCYLHPGWKPLIRPAAATREWMDATPEAFAYRCLPLNIANAHGWEILNPFAFEAYWKGGNSTDDVILRLPSDVPAHAKPVSLFGQGVLTFHIYGIFRTPPGWNLWVGGSPNAPKDAIYPLTGIIETDWAPYTFTMNWRFTRTDHWVRFEENEPICFVFPLQRSYLDDVTPKYLPMDRDPELLKQFKAWSASRDAFQAKVSKELPASGTDKWQKRYYRGLDMTDRQAVPDHQIKPRLADFTADGQVPIAVPKAPAKPTPAAKNPAPAAKPTTAPPQVGQSQPDRPAAAADQTALQNTLREVAVELMFGAAPEGLVARLIAVGAPEAEARRIIETGLADPLMVNARMLATAVRKRDWLLDTMESHWRLKPGFEKIERRVGLSGDEFLERYYAAGRPVILTGEMADWPALSKWTPDYLKEKIGARTIEYQGERTRNPRFELDKDAHKREMPFDSFIDQIQMPGAGNDAYITAYNSRKNTEAVAPLHSDLGFPGHILDKNIAPANGMLWIGPAGTVTSLHHDLTDNLIAQVVGRKRFKIAAAADVAKLYNFKHVFSVISDLEAPEANATRYPALKDLQLYDVVLNPGEMIFVPVGWWHQVKSIDFSVTITYTNFRHRNDWSRTYPES